MVTRLLALLAAFAYLRRQSGLAAPFEGAFLVPDPTGGFGSWVLSSTWPTGVPSGFPVWLQGRAVDPGAPVAFAASDGIVATTP